MIYYHSSDKFPELGTIFDKTDPSRGENYKSNWQHTDFYCALEKYRPNNKIAHKDAVFICDTIEEIELCGGCEESILLLRTEDEITWHDLNWSSEISMLVSNGFDIDSEEVKNAAEKYWSGTPHPDESVWEGIAEKATVVAVFDFEEDEEFLEKERQKQMNKIKSKKRFKP